MIACFKDKDGKLPDIKIGCCIGVTMESQLGQQKSFIFLCFFTTRIWKDITCCCLTKDPEFYWYKKQKS